MPEKTPGGQMPKQTGTTQKTPSGDRSNPKAVETNPGFKGGSGKGGGGKK